MKRMRVLIVALVAALACAFPAVAFADQLTGSSNWSVTFTSDEKMEDNFSANEYADQVGHLQPGDDITFTVALHHENSQAADWYMANEVLKTLEEGSATGSAYGYKLTYIDPSGTERELYNSETVGGDSSQGLFEATNALDDYFYLDNLQYGDTASVKLVVSLDGETEGNAYFDKLARLQMKFAVELPSPNTVENREEHTTVTENTVNNTTTNQTIRANDANRNVVRTGDGMVELMPFFIAMIVSGALFLALAVYSVRLRRRA